MLNQFPFFGNATTTPGTVSGTISSRGAVEDNKRSDADVADSSVDSSLLTIELLRRVNKFSTTRNGVLCMSRGVVRLWSLCWGSSLDSVLCLFRVILISVDAMSIELFL